MEAAERARVRREVLLVFALELLYEVVDETVIAVLTTQVVITGSGLDFEDTVIDDEEGHIEGSSTKIEDEDIPLA